MKDLTKENLFDYFTKCVSLVKVEAELTIYDTVDNKGEIWTKMIKVSLGFDGDHSTSNLPEIYIHHREGKFFIGNKYTNFEITEEEFNLLFECGKNLEVSFKQYNDTKILEFID